MAAPSKQYGLIFPKKAQQKTLIKHSVFMEDSDDEASVGESLQREALKKQAMKQTKLEIQRALTEDSTVYEYDKIYDDIQQKKRESHTGLLSGKEEKKPKYIQNILKAAELRKKEQEKRMEKKIQKEREMEGGAFDDKEAFVTSAYKKKLQERAEEEEREKKEAALEACLDVTKQKDLSGFYRHLLNQSVGEEEVPKCSLREARVKEEKPSDSRPTSRSPEVKREPPVPLRGGSSPDIDSEVEMSSPDREDSAKGHADESKEARQRKADPSGEDSKLSKSQRDSRSCSEDRSSRAKVCAAHPEREEGGGSRKERSGQHRERDPERRQRDKEEHPRSEDHYRRQEERDNKQRKKDRKEREDYNRESRKERKREKHSRWQQEGKEGVISNKDHGKDGEREERDKGAKIREPKDEKERKSSSPQSSSSADRNERGEEQPSDLERVSGLKHRSAGEETEQVQKPLASQNKFAKRSNEETVISARDRYLARQMARVSTKAYIEKEED
ncbi:nuclear speckle splicing regulatory protein 1 [Eublepharis macularius]|uniref:Nuclear speckle splicing regulatory protein 1 n=1 Tax=Eublepharis macularius TaxID=481883 RepID=A0AA97KIV5_EUBMA|nr:nuclear speckle splicing regulatory protein 1 [Eublepharis macularius]